MTTQGPRWLSDDEQQAWRAYLRGSRVVEQALDADLTGAGVNLAEYELISMLSEAEGGRMRMAALADLVVQSRSRVSHTASRLERRGWVRRERCDDDRRGIWLTLTAEGLTAITELAPLHVESVRRHLVARLTPAELDRLGQIMRILQQGAAPSSGDS